MAIQSETANSKLQRMSRFSALYLLAPLLLLLEIPVAVHIAQQPVTGITVHNLIVRMVEQDSPAEKAGVSTGDRILAVDGEPVVTMVDYYSQSAGHYDLSARSYLMQRNDEFLSIHIAPHRPSKQRMIRSYSLSLAGIAFLLMGWFVLTKRDDLVTRYFYALCTLFAFFLMDIPDWPSPAWMTAKEITRDLAHLLLPVVFLRFLIYFPTRSHLTKDNRKRHRLLWIPFWPLMLASIYAQVAQLDPSTSLTVATIQGVSTIYMLVWIVAGLVIFGKKALSKDRGIAKHKMHSVLVGLLFGIMPFLVGNIMYMLNPAGGFPMQAWLGLSLILIPVSFGLAILRHGALDYDQVIRHGLVYFFLSILIASCYLIIVSILGHTLTNYFNISSYPLALSTIALCALLFTPIKQKIHSVVENTFYPSRQATRDAIEELCHKISGMIDRAESVEIILTRLNELYRPEQIVIFTENDNFKPESSNGIELPKDISIDIDSTLSRVLQTANRPIHTDEIDGLDTEPATDTATLNILSRLDPKIIIPLITGNNLCGFITMGNKSSGNQYTQSDIRNLHFLSVQVAALLEVQRLYIDTLEQKRLDTELSVAKNIQEQLVPDSELISDNITLCGSMNSCREVGGDYFDYFKLPDGRIGFAIADAVGKGIPAALIMTTLRVAFRSAAAVHGTPEKVVAEVNDTICNLASVSQFVCFFYGIIDPANCTLNYSNAGMNPPMHFSSTSNWTGHLKKGGLVLGIDSDQYYAQGTIHTKPGDTILLYTDGLTEESNSRDEMFGAEQLELIVKKNAHLPPKELRDKILSDIDIFSEGQQADDRTLIVLRINQL